MARSLLSSENFVTFSRQNRTKVRFLNAFNYWICINAVIPGQEVRAGACRETPEINGTWKQYSGRKVTGKNPKNADRNTASIFHRFPEFYCRIWWLSRLFSSRSALFRRPESSNWDHIPLLWRLSYAPEHSESIENLYKHCLTQRHLSKQSRANEK